MPKMAMKHSNLLKLNLLKIPAVPNINLFSWILSCPVSMAFKQLKKLLNFSNQPIKKI
jgi:hypothetical protein